MKKADRDRAVLEAQLQYLEGYTAALKVMLTGGAPPLLLPGLSNGASGRSKPDLSAAFSELHGDQAIEPTRSKRSMPAAQRDAIRAGQHRRFARRKMTMTPKLLKAMQRNAAIARAAKAAKNGAPAKKKHWTQTPAGRAYFASKEGKAKQRAANLARQAAEAGAGR